MFVIFQDVDVLKQAARLLLVVREKAAQKAYGQTAKPLKTRKRARAGKLHAVNKRTYKIRLML